MAQDTRRRRVGAELHRLLNELLRKEVKDPRLEDVTVTEVEVSGDLSVAKIYYVTLDPDAPDDDPEAGFRKASGFLRGRIGQSLRLRRAPELHFIRDETARRGAELTRLIESLRPEDDEGQGADEGQGDGPSPDERRGRSAGEREAEDDGPRPPRDTDEH